MRVLLGLLVACTPSPIDPDPPRSLTVTDEAVSANYQDWVVGRTFKRGRGCTFGDFDGDGRDDVLLLNPGNISFLMRNVTPPGGPIRLEPAQVLPGRSFAWMAAAADVDNDGDVDLFVGVGGLEGYGPDRLLRNDSVPGEIRFVDVTDEAGVRGPYNPRTDKIFEAATMGATFVDVDRDGWVDLYVDGHIMPLHLWDDLPEGTLIGRNTLWHNQGDGTFVDITEQAGLTHIAPSRYSVWLDVDGDGDDDLFENNWDVAPNVFWRNLYMETGELRFEDATEEWSLDGDLRFPLETFTAATEDLNNDGWPDLVLFVRGMASAGPYRNGHVVLINLEGRGFVDASEASNLNDPFEPGYLRDHISLGVMGAQVADVNNDGLPDVFIGNGGPSQGFVNQLFLSTGLEEHVIAGETVTVPRYANRSDLIDFPAPRHPDWGPYPPYPYRTHGTCVVDLDGDGQLEIAVSNGGMSFFGGSSMFEPNRLFVFRQDPPPRWLKVDVRGDHRVGTDALATVVHVRAAQGDRSWSVRRTVRTSNGFSAQNPHTLHFGLGDADRIEALEVRWPDGRVDHLEPPKLNQRITVSR